MSRRRHPVARRIVAAASALVLALLAAGCADEGEIESSSEARLAEADVAFRSREYDRAGELYESVAEDAYAAGDTTTYVEACAMRARSHLVSSRQEEARPWLERAEARADVSEPLAWSRYLGARGRFEWTGGDSARATTTFREMFDYCRERELWSRAADAAHMVALTGDREERFEWAKRGIEMAESGGLDEWLGPLWNNLGWDYHDEERYDEALEALTKAREHHYRGEAELPKLIADYSVAHVKRMLGRYGEAEAELRAVLNGARRLHEEGNGQAIEWMGMSRWELGEIALAEGREADGLRLLEHALVELESAGMPEWGPDDWASRQARVEELRAAQPAPPVPPEPEDGTPGAAPGEGPPGGGYMGHSGDA